MINTATIGRISEFRFKAKILELGYDTLTPDTDALPYDFIIEKNKKFYKIQVKTGRITKPGVIRFNTCGTMCNMTKMIKKTYRGKIDYFGVYCLENEGYYLIPVNKAGTREMCLRIDKPKNNNKKNINWAKDYTVELQLKKKW